MADRDGKRAAAAAALDHVEEGMTLGLGTGSTAAHFVVLLGARVRDGLRVKGVPTSEATAKLALAHDIPLVELGPSGVDLAVDGADEIGPGLALVKGGGGALLREKIVAASARRFIVIADATKKVTTLGAFPLPVEIVRFGWRATMERALAALEPLCPGVRATPRGGRADLAVTDEGHYIVDFQCRTIAQPAEAARRLADLTGVVETGLFIDMADLALIGGEDGVQDLRK